MSAAAGLKYIGTRPVRPDGLEKVTGRANFGADHALPGMLYGKVVRSPHAHARIKSIDTSAAEAMPGVLAVVTAADFPDRSQMSWRRKGFNDNLLASDKVLYHGHAVAAVAATSNQAAEAAAAAVVVDYEVLDAVTDALAAHGAGRPGPARRPVHRGAAGNPGDALQPGQEASHLQGRRGSRVRRGRRGRRTHVHDADGAPGLHRAPRLRRQLQRGRPGHRVVPHPGSLRRAVHDRHGDGHGRGRHPRHRQRDRRRLRRQDHHLSRTARAQAVAEERSPGEDGDDPRGRVPRHRPGVRYGEYRERSDARATAPSSPCTPS